MEGMLFLGAVCFYCQNICVKGGSMRSFSAARNSENRAWLTRATSGSPKLQALDAGMGLPRPLIAE